MTNVSRIGSISPIQAKSKLAASDTNYLTMPLAKRVNDEQKPRQTISPPAVLQRDCKRYPLETNQEYQLVSIRAQTLHLVLLASLL